MNWDAVQLAAKAKGQLVFAMDQAQLPIQKVPILSNLTEQGFCMGLAVTWISKQYKGGNFDHSGQVCEWPPIKAVLYQTIYDTIGNYAWDQEWAVAGAVEQLGVSGGLKGKRDAKPSASFIHSIVTKAYGCYGFSAWSPGGHAMALRHHPDNSMHFFDPNYGHFKVKDHTELKPFLRWFFANTSYTGDYSKHCVVGIKPPIGMAK